MHMQRMLRQKDSEIVGLKVERDRKATECEGLHDVIHHMKIQNTEHRMLGEKAKDYEKPYSFWA